MKQSIVMTMKYYYHQNTIKKARKSKYHFYRHSFQIFTISWRQIESAPAWRREYEYKDIEDDILDIEPNPGFNNLSYAFLCNYINSKKNSKLEVV